MIAALELKKLKRTGSLFLTLAAAAVSAMFPILNTAVRSEQFVRQQDAPLNILLDANWELMSMINMLFLLCLSCLIYHTEYAGNANTKMDTLPFSPSLSFLAKLMVLILAAIAVLMIEYAALAFCIIQWFPSAIPGPALAALLAKNLAWSAWQLLPVCTLMLTIAYAFKNMWIPLGIGVICIFTATMLTSFGAFPILALFPFALPLKTFLAAGLQSLAPAGIETFIFFIIEMLLIHIRRR
ncbi:MAG: ABC transporter permease [Clostridiales bacterium]|nr:ABC transporter permease [Clostridiales bacterium]